jgi:hypothetical protein
LDGEMAHPTFRAEYTHALPFTQRAVVEQALPCAEARECERGALNMGQALRFGCEHGCWHDDVVGGGSVAVERHQRENLVTYRDIVGAVSELRDDAG